MADTVMFGFHELTDFTFKMYGLITLHNEAYQPLADLTWIQNKVVYAEKHGYAAICKTNGFREGSGIGYQKIYFAKEVLETNPELEWIWWTGTDTLITNFAVRIEDRIDNNYHFIICVDVNGINADSLLIRNSPEAIKFLDAVIAIEEESSKHWDCEQRAIARVIGVPVPPEHWPISPFAPIAESEESIVKVMPQRFMNSFNYQLYHYTDQRDKLGLDGNWQPGDWLIHWPATQLELRLQLAEFYNKYILK
jgi:hypothetical protein